MVRSGDVVLAHAFGERYELPVPLWLFAVGGAAVVALSFVLPFRRTSDTGTTVDAEDTVPERDLRPLPGLLSIAVTAFVGYVGLTGTQEPSYNIAPLFLWLLLWIAVPLTCGLIGDWTSSVNPFAVIARLGDHVGLRKAVLARSRPLTWSARLGWWPAVGLFVLLVLGELVFNLDATRPAFVGALLLLYLVASFVLGLLFGPSWSARGEVLSGLFDAWGRLGWFRFGAPGRRGFAGGLEAGFDRSPSRVVFVLLLLVTINFDGILSTPQWADYERRTLGADPGGVELLRTVSLAGLILVVLAIFAAFALASARAGGSSLPPLAALAVLLPSLVPIAYGYLVAHYLQYLLTNGQLLVPLASNPGFGRGNSSYEVDLELLPNAFYWYLSVVVIVAVHVVAVVLARRAAVGQAGWSRRSEYPWLVAMVAYTALSLTLIAQPLTTSEAVAALRGISLG